MMDHETDPLLNEIGTAVFRLRRIWYRPGLMRGTPELHQVSDLMVADAIGRLTASGPAVTVGAVAEQLDIDPSTASRLVAHATAAGLINRRPCSGDGRRADLRLTAAGERIRQAVRRLRAEYLADLIADWSAAERADFARLLTRFADAATRREIRPEGLDQIFA